MGRLRWIICAISFVALAGASATAGLVEPDDYPAGTDISSLFAGVTLSDEGTFAGNGVFSVVGNFPSTGSRVFGPNTSAPDNWVEAAYVLRADFAALTDYVSIDVIPDDSSDPGFLRAYNASGILLAEYLTPSSAPMGTVFTAFITRPTKDISYIRAAGVAGDTVLLDNLRFGSIPEPTTIALLGVGLLTLVAVRRRRARN